MTSCALSATGANSNQYEIEAATRGRSAEERRVARQSRSRPLVEGLHVWLTEQPK